MNTVVNQDSLHNVNIVDEKVLLTPAELKAELPLPEYLRKQIETSRREISDIIHKRDQRKLIVIGPCSIHDPIAAIEYGKKIKGVSRYRVG